MYTHIARKKRAKVLLFFDMTKFFKEKMQKTSILSLLFAYMMKFLYLCSRF